HCAKLLRFRDERDDRGTVGGPAGSDAGPGVRGRDARGGARGRAAQQPARGGCVKKEMRTGVLAGNHNAPRSGRDVRFSTLLRRRGCTRCVRRIVRTVTPRGTDWSLALLVALGLGTGLATWFAGSPHRACAVGAPRVRVAR